MTLEDKSVILFYGDSITDAEREKDSGLDLGKGFVRLLGSYLGYKNPDKFFKIINRGVGGDSIYELVKRLDYDCLAFPVDVLSILVGVNDSTFRLWVKDTPAPIAPEEFERCYRRILDAVRKKNPKIQLVLCTPYMVEKTAEHRINKELLRHYVPIIHRLAEEYQAILVPYFEEMEKRINEGTADGLTNDGVHPTEAGTFFLAEIWAENVVGEYICG